MSGKYIVVSMFRLDQGRPHAVTDTLVPRGFPAIPTTTQTSVLCTVHGRCIPVPMQASDDVELATALQQGAGWLAAHLQATGC